MIYKVRSQFEAAPLQVQHVLDSTNGRREFSEHEYFFDDGEKNITRARKRLISTGGNLQLEKPAGRANTSCKSLEIYEGDEVRAQFGLNPEKGLLEALDEKNIKIFADYFRSRIEFSLEGVDLHFDKIMLPSAQIYPVNELEMTVALEKETVDARQAMIAFAKKYNLKLLARNCGFKEFLFRHHPEVFTQVYTDQNRIKPIGPSSSRVEAKV